MKNLSYLVDREYFNHENHVISKSFVSAFYEFCNAEEYSDNPMQVTIDRIVSRIQHTSSAEFETAGLYGNQLKTKIELVTFNWGRFTIDNIISPKRWLECLKSLMLSIFSIYGGDEAHKELLDMGINIITDQLPVNTL
jgi:hypothetical protein|tara:strand:+ start:1101 stop:1514 length:414 start_codon:yes stop_codon:yes gene_type:complete